MVQQKIGHLLQLDFSYSIKYDWVSLDEISPNMQLAVIAAEDQKFPHHWGFDFEAIQKAFKIQWKISPNPRRFNDFTANCEKPRFSGMDKVGFVKG